MLILFMNTLVRGGLFRCSADTFSLLSAVYGVVLLASKDIYSAYKNFFQNQILFILELSSGKFICAEGRK